MAVQSVILGHYMATTQDGIHKKCLVRHFQSICARFVYIYELFVFISRLNETAYHTAFAFDGAENVGNNFLENICSKQNHFAVISVLCVLTFFKKTIRTVRLRIWIWRSTTSYGDVSTGFYRTFLQLNVHDQTNMFWM